MQDTAYLRGLFASYVGWWGYVGSVRQRRTAGKPVQTPMWSAEWARALERMVEWCHERDLDSRWWLYCLFAARMWATVPARKDLRSERLLSWYHDPRVDPGLFSPRLSSPADPNRDIIHAIEARKSAMLAAGMSAVCLAVIDGASYGFHPKSQVCQVCPLRGRCEEKTRRLAPFDLVALRAGEIAPDQARFIAANCH